MSAGGSRLQTWLLELRRRKVVRVAIMYLVGAWVLVQVASTTFTPLGLPEWSVRMVILLAALGFPLACGLAWAFDVTPQGIERTAPLARSAVPAVAAEGAAANELVAGTAPAVALPAAGPSVAILPFLDLSPARDQEYFCDGIAEEIINALCCVRGLRVASRTSSFQFKSRSSDVRDIGRSLGASAVLEGSVRKDGDRVRITAQLVSSADGYHHWSESFDRRLEDVFEIQTEIAHKLVSALRLTLTQQEIELIDRDGTSNAEAYDFYLRGQAYQRDLTDNDRAAEMFRQAIRHDPNFAQAHAGLANVIAIKAAWRLDMTPELFDEAFAASRRALQLQPRMPEAFVATACLMSMQGRNADAVAAFEEAIRLNPASYDAHYLYARHCFAAGATEQAVSEFEVAARLRPEEYQPLCLLANTLEKLGRKEAAIEASRRAMQVIERRLVFEPNDSRALHLGAVAAAKLGDVAKVKDFGARCFALRPEEFGTLYNLACAYAQIGEQSQALDWLDGAVKHGRGNLGWIEHDPDLDPLRGHPRFEAIVSRLRASPAGTDH